MPRQFLTLALLLTLAGCGAPPAAQSPVEVTRVVQQEVTREVVAVHTQVVIVTATPEPASPTAVATLEPTATEAPTAAPEPTATEAPTAVPEPTAVPLLPEGETVPGRIMRTIRVLDIPNEAEGKMVINAVPGNTVDILYRGGQWYQVQGKSDSGDTVTGWVYKDWIKIAPEDEVRLQPNPAPLPVLITKITQTIGNDGRDYWSGSVMNIGAKTAYDVQMEIQLTGYAGGSQTVADRQSAFVKTRNLEPGQSAKFVVVTRLYSHNDAHYTYKVLWTER